MTTSETAGNVVVGVDGSQNSRRALEWALAEAQLRGVGCVLIHAWDYGPSAASPFPGDAPQILADDAKAILARELAFASRSPVSIKGELAFGPASRALVEASHDALLVVVGSRGRGSLATALLGSVSAACVHRARCPVVVTTSSGVATAQEIKRDRVATA